ncbi:MAG: DUF1778 domain-containing protein [Candidatus Solibacter sp.]|jgi:uncharacterized protein (DUF1778 family)
MKKRAVEGNSRTLLGNCVAKAVPKEADRVRLSERDSLRVLELLENPLEPNARLLAAAQALPRRS